MVNKYLKTFQAIYYSRMLGVVVFITFFTLVALWLVYEINLSTAEDHYAAKVDVISDKVRNRLSDNLAVISALSGWYHSQNRVSHSELNSFSSEMLANYPHIQAILYMPKIPQNNKTRFEKQKREEGYADFHIKKLDDTLHYVPVSQRENYFPITFIDPLDPDTVHFLGLDASAVDRLSSPMQLAIESGETTVSSLIETLDGSKFFFLFKAVYKGKILPSTKQGRIKQSDGVFALVVNPDYLASLVLQGISGFPSLVTLRYQGEDINEPLTTIFYIDEGVRGRAGSILPTVNIEKEFSDEKHPFILDFSRQMTMLDIGLYLPAGIIFVYLIMIYLARSALRSDYLHDIDNEKAKDAIYQEKERAEITLHSIADGVITTDIDDRIEYMNEVAEFITGWESAEATGKYLDDVFLILTEEKRELIHDLMDIGEPDKDVIRHVLLKRYDGKEHVIKLSASYIHERSGGLVGKVIIFSDVTKEREMANLLSHQARHDELTGLLNRREFESYLKVSLDKSEADGKHDVLCFIDLDQFKVVNDTCGHIAGDELLKQITKLLRDNIRETDVLARLGGDEFGIIFMNCPISKAMEIAKLVHNEVRDYRFSWHEKSFDVGASMGLVEVTSRIGSLAEVMSAADSACYVAKDQGRNRIFAHTLDSNELLIRQGEMHWVHKINKAFEMQRFCLFRQKIVPIRNDSDPVHYEVLLRMRDESGNIVPPMAFLPAAERYSMMPEIDRWVVDQALKRISEGALSNVIYNINLSGKSISDEGFLEFIIQKIEGSKVNPSNICFEITETAAVSNLSSAVRFFDILKSYGCKLALDDFGSGISSFMYLKNLPVDYLKIDGSFVRDMVDDPVDREMVSSISKIGHVMNLLTVAEFVESDSIKNALVEIGVDYAQGFSIAKPEEW